MRMNKKELKQILYLDELIDSKIRILESLRLRRFNIGATQFKDDKVQKTNWRNYQEDLIIKISDLEKDITKDVDRLVDIKAKAKKEIDKLDNPYRLVMSMRYLECLKWRDIAHHLGYSVQAVYKIHGQALKRVE